jgi:hypothetical protein
MQWIKGFLIVMLMTGLGAVLNAACDRSAGATPSSATARLASHETNSIQGFESQVHSSPDPDLLRIHVKEGKPHQEKTPEKRHKRTRESKAFMAKRIELPVVISYIRVRRRVLYFRALSTPDILVKTLRGPPVPVC